MTDPTAKGYTAPTIEEMKAAIESNLSQRGARVGSWGSEDSIRGMYSKLPEKAAPTSDGNEISSHTHCSGPCCMPELYESGIKGCKLPANSVSEPHNVTYGHSACETTTGQREYVVTDTQIEAAPESEDEAFEQWFADEYPQCAKIMATATAEDDYESGFESVRSATWRDKEKARKGWNARARLDAERGR